MAAATTRPPRKGSTATTPYLRLAEVAVRFDVAEKTVRRWLQAGRIKAVRLPGGGLRIPAGELAKLEKTT